MSFRLIAVLLPATLLVGCVTPYPKVKDTASAAYLELERSFIAPPLGSITRYAKVDDKQQCNQSYAGRPFLAVQNKGNPLVDDLNPNGLYIYPDSDFRIQINTVAGSASCDVIVGFDVKAGERYKIKVVGEVWGGTKWCRATLYRQQSADGGAPRYVETAFKEYVECSK